MWFLTFLEHLKRMLGSSLIDNFLLTMNGPYGLSRASEVHQRNPWEFTHFEFDNRSNTERCRFHQSFALPDKDVELQSMWCDVRWCHVMWCDVMFWCIVGLVCCVWLCIVYGVCWMCVVLCYIRKCISIVFLPDSETAPQRIKPVSDIFYLTRKWRPQGRIPVGNLYKFGK